MGSSGCLLRNSWRAVVSESGWIAQREAARLLGVHPSLVPKMLRRGDLTSRGQRPSLCREEVLDLAAKRADDECDRLLRQSSQFRGPRGPRPPDGLHDGLGALAAAAVLGCTTIALQGRCPREQVPYAVHDGRRWVRLNLLELLVRARVARVARERGTASR